MMRPYWQKFGGRVRLVQIMQVAGINIWDLPFLNKHADGNGRNKLCWPNVPGYCTRGNCWFIHEKVRDLPEAFVKKACLKLKNGVNWVFDTHNALTNNPFDEVICGSGQ